jgi:hypothetical protein
VKSWPKEDAQFTQSSLRWRIMGNTRPTGGGYILPPSGGLDNGDGSPNEFDGLEAHATLLRRDNSLPEPLRHDHHGPPGAAHKKASVVTDVQLTFAGKSDCYDPWSHTLTVSKADLKIDEKGHMLWNYTGSPWENA